MNTWGNEFNLMQNQYGLPMNHMMAPNMMGMMPNPMIMMPDIPPAINRPTAPENPLPLIGPVAPEGFIPRNENSENNEDTQKEAYSEAQQHDRNQRGPNRKDNRRERDFRDRGDRGRKRSRSPYRNDRTDGMNQRNRPDDRNDRGRRDRRTKWGNNQNHPGMHDHGMNQVMNPGMNQGMNPAMGNMMMPGMMSPFNNMMGQPMDMQNDNMSNMAQMGTMGTMGNMPMHGMPGMVPGMNMMPNMMDQNMMIMQQRRMSNQPLFVADSVLLPPIPGGSILNRREKPPGCRTIFIGGLPSGIKEEVITEIFQRFGQIVGVKLHRQGVCHVRFENHSSVEDSFIVSGWRFKFTDQTDNEATTLFIDYALNREDQAEYERNKRKREPTPPPIEMFSPQALTNVMEKIKSDEQFAEAAPTLAAWLARGECNKKNSNTFYSLIQASNNQTRRLFNEKMTIDEDLEKMKSQLRDKFQHIIIQFENIAKILTAAKHQRVSDHFTKQQRRNIEMWLKMTEEVENMREEYNALFDEEESEKPGKNAVPLEKYEQLKQENENLQFELEGYKNEAYLAKDEAERKFEKFKAHFIAQNALQNSGQKPQGQFPPMPPPPMPSLIMQSASNPQPPPPPPDDEQSSGKSVQPSEAKLISILTAFLLVHPLGATLDYLTSYMRSLLPSITHSTVHNVLRKYSDIFQCSGGSMQQQKWTFVTFDIIKKE